MKILVTFGLLALHTLALLGWGRLVERRLRLPASAAPVGIALGLALVIVLGGVCNALGLAYAPATWLVTALGLGLAISDAWRGPAAPRLSRASVGVTVPVIVLALLIISATLIPPLAFDFHDDYQKYFAHPVRMLETGSVHGSSVSAIGFETLGGQAWLHAFVLGLAGVDMLNAVELGLCFALCLGLVGVGSVASPVSIAARGVALLGVLVINPQIVNVSATYSGAALLLAIWLLPTAALGADEGPSPPSRAHALATGLCLAALCALKTSFVLFGALLGASLLLAVLVQTRSIAHALRWSASCLAATAVCVAPWLFVHAPSYLAALNPDAAMALHAPPTAIYSVSLASLEPVLYGEDSFASYTWAVVCGLGIGGYAWWAAPRVQERRTWPAVAAFTASIALALAYVGMLYVVAPRSQGAITTMRLLAPMFLATLPLLLLLADAAARPTQHGLRLVPLLLLLAALVPWRAGAPTRLMQAVQYGSVLAFPALATDPSYLRYNHDVLRGPMRARVLRAQHAVPAGAPLIAWINAPFMLDFRRNPIADLEPAGLATPWTAIPRASYVIWEFNGAATTQLSGYHGARAQPSTLEARIGAAGLRLTRAMIDLARSSQVLMNDGQIMVLRLGSPDALRARYAAKSPSF